MVRCSDRYQQSPVATKGVGRFQLAGTTLGNLSFVAKAEAPDVTELWRYNKHDDLINTLGASWPTPSRVSRVGN